LNIVIELIQKSFVLFKLDWKINPIQITVLTTDFPVEKIPFPTITICRKQNNPNGLRFVSKVTIDVEINTST
jgi:hypothetical protein